MKKMKNKEKFVLTTKLLVDPTGKKMGKTEGNMINLDDNPQNMYGKIMSWPDGLIALCFELCTRVPLEEIEKIKKMSNPRDQKALLAKEIVGMYHGKDAAQKAENEFDKIFRDKELPSDMPVFEIPKGSPKKQYFVLDLLFDAKLAPSKNEAKRLVEGGGVEIQNQNSKIKIQNWREEIKLEDGMIIKVGHRKFVKIKIK
jgi:tyrosyl-tRNA synthetase